MEKGETSSTIHSPPSTIPLPNPNHLSIQPDNNSTPVRSKSPTLPASSTSARRPPSPSPRQRQFATCTAVAYGEDNSVSRERQGAAGPAPQGLGFLDGSSNDKLTGTATFPSSLLTTEQPSSTMPLPPPIQTSPGVAPLKNHSSQSLQGYARGYGRDVSISNGNGNGNTNGHGHTHGHGHGHGLEAGGDSDAESSVGWSSPAWSPALDPDSKPQSPNPPPYSLYRNNSQGHGGNTSWLGYSPVSGAGINLDEKLMNGGYAAFPLSGPGEPYNYPTIRENAPTGWAAIQDSSAYWLGMYFFFNLGLTLFNKVVLQSFPFPYTLTGLHALSGCAGCYIALERGAFTPARLTSRENVILAAFSVLYTINIAVSNISLQLVTVSFHQVVRAATPFFAILISTVILRTRFSMMKLVALLPVVAGVGFATYGDYYFTAWGLILTLLGTFLAALKTVMINVIQTGSGGRLKLHPLDLLMRMSPLAFIQCVVYGWSTGELEKVRKYGATQMTQSKAIALLVNGVIACGLNIVSFTANKKLGPLTMTVSANCKQVMTIALGVVLFDLHINFTNGIGIVLTLIGGACYGWVEYQEKQRKTMRFTEKS